MIVAAALLALCLSYVALRAYLPLAGRMRLLDKPNSRSAHSNDTLNSGGLPIVIAILLSLVLVSEVSGLHFEGEFKLMLAALLGICALGAWDDWRPLPASLRLGVFFSIATIIAVCYSPAELGPALLVLPLLILALSWLFNLYNFMDGIDALAGVQTVLCALGLLLAGLFYDAPLSFLLMTIITAAAYAAFLFLNWPPARLFMGDSGSLSAGFILGWLGLWGWRDGFLPPGLWLILMSPFLLDASLTLARRILRREKLAEGHSQHCYQRLSRHWNGHKPVVLTLLLLQLCWLMPLAVALVIFPSWQWTFIALGLFPQLFLIAKSWRLT